MSWEKRWEVLEELGEGGQGKVKCVRDKSEYDIKGEISKKLRDALQTLGGGAYHKRKISGATEKFVTLLPKLIEAQNPENHYALKILHDTQEAKDPDKAQDRIQKEIATLESINHDHVLNIIDANDKEGWFVSDYYPRGPLSDHITLFEGDFERCLSAFHGIVDAVATLHDKGIQHRDIKPENVFLTKKNSLVLGDFGIVFRGDEERVTDPLESVGTHNWMPPWAFGGCVNQPGPQFDVYSLGKVLWSMVTGRSKLPLTFDEEEEKEFDKSLPDTLNRDTIKSILNDCVVYQRDECLGNAGDLLQRIDSARRKLNNKHSMLTSNGTRPCLCCDNGEYKEIASPYDNTDIENFGLSPKGKTTFRVLTCDQCGHVQLFRVQDDMDVYK